jgi:hypothetical protein
VLPTAAVVTAVVEVPLSGVKTVWNLPATVRRPTQLPPRQSESAPQLVKSASTPVWTQVVCVSAALHAVAYVAQAFAPEAGVQGSPATQACTQPPLLQTDPPPQAVPSGLSPATLQAGAAVLDEHDVA